MKLGSLCSGGGQLDEAVTAVTGARTVWHCEINDAASKVLEYRYPGMPNHRDLTTTDWDTVEPIDILTGGYPCQPFSAAGRRKGTDDDRHIWPHVREAIRRLRPRLTVLENVAGHRSLGFDRVLGDLAEDGLHVWWTSLRAADIGSCHGRERLFIFATPDTEGMGWGDGSSPYIGSSHREVNSFGNYRDGDGVVDLLPTPVVTDSFGARNSTCSRSNPNSRHHSGDTLTDVMWKLLPTPSTHDATGARTAEQRDAMDKPFSNLNDTVVNELLSTPQARDSKGIPKDGFNTACLPRDIAECAVSFGKYEPAVRRWELLTRPAPTPTEPGVAGLKRPRLNPAFSEWMMGWPAGWVTEVPGLTRKDQLHIIGNGVVPHCAAAALSWLFVECGVTT